MTCHAPNVTSPLLNSSLCRSQHRQGARQAYRGFTFSITSPASLWWFETILMPYFHFLFQNVVKSHLNSFSALSMSLILLQSLMPESFPESKCETAAVTDQVLFIVQAPRSFCAALRTATACISGQALRHIYLVEIVASILDLLKGCCLFYPQSPA